MDESQPRLVELANDGAAIRPEELEGQPITILDSIEVQTRDGRMTAQWVVRRPDQSVVICWAAGRTPGWQVAQWFHDNPHRPLYATLSRTTDQFGNNVWRLTQRPPDASASTASPLGTVADVVDQVPF